MYFSYDTMIAFEIDGQMYASENVWSHMTGTHLGVISAKGTRLAHKYFKQLVKEKLEPLFSK